MSDSHTIDGILTPNGIRRAIRWEGRLSRRLFLHWAAALTSVPFFAQQTTGQVSSRPHFAHDPFALGVASGDCDDSSVVLWTRLAPRPLEPEGGMAPFPVDVQWELSEDEAMSRIIRAGKVRSSPVFAHSTHVVVEGLKPDRWYWYRFQAGDAISPVGRTRTMPQENSVPERLKFAFASCQHFEQGLFTAYDHMRGQDLDMIFHLGDYIYEGAPGITGVRTHAGPRLIELKDYRIRHAQYRSDPWLHRAHALCPWWVTWDDHEFDNNYADSISQTLDADPAEFLIQRTAAYQSFYEMMPLRPDAMPRGPDMKLYRGASFGRLAQFHILDTRQYRSDQPNGDKSSEINAEALDPKSSMLGARQREWLQSGLTGSKSLWNVLAQQVMMAMADIQAGSDKKYSMDQWPGCAYERMRLLKFIQDRRVKNPIVLTGDIHSNWVNQLRVDDRKPETRIVATEFVGTSISSGGNGSDRSATQDELLRENPCVQFHNRQRGYVKCTVTDKWMRADYIVMDQVLKPGGKASTRSSWIVHANQPGATLA